MKPPMDHTFRVNGDTYRLVEWDSGGEIRIHTEYAIALAPSPESIRLHLGRVLYARAVARECLKEAPEGFDVDHVPREDWEAFLEGVSAFLGKLFPDVQPELEGAPSAVPERPDDVAPVETLPAAFTGRAG